MRDMKDSRRANTANIFESAVYSKRNVHHLSEICGFAAICSVILLALLSRHILHERLPKALGNTDILHTESAFIAERAWKDLKILTSFGPRVAGSYSNEVLAVDFLKREISFIKQTANKNQRIEWDLQVVSGAYYSKNKPYSSVSMYRNVQNIIVKLLGESRLDENESKEDVKMLLNCHFDSVPGSPGASDDGCPCVTMLEVLRVLSRKPQRNKHTIVFLFNGAEETGLQASHGFITQHRWAHNIKAFINLESVGSSGKELLFQSSSNNTWMIKMYGKSAPHPFAQVAAEEIFHSGLIPSDTDFRQFQEYGGIPGVDFAYMINGYRYHTKFDHIDYISKDSLQHTGDNILEFTTTLANSDDLESIKELSSEAPVYFDFLGLIFIHYSEKFATIFNYTLVTCSVLLPYALLSLATKGINKKHLRFEIFLGFLINMISLVVSYALCYAIAYDLDIAGKSMSWYTNTFICLPLYCNTTIFVQCVFHLIFDRNSKSPLSLSLRCQGRLIGTCFFWGILAAALTGANIRTAYAFVVPLAITLFSYLAIGILHYQNSIKKWLYVYLIGQVFVILWTAYLGNMIVDVFIPTAGRSGGNKNPDIMIGIICSSLTLFTTSYLSPLVILLRKSKNLLITMFAIYIVTRFYFITFTHFGFPYQDERLGAPRVQRHYITHALRTLYDKEGKIRYTDSGFLISEMDRNAHKTVESLTMPEEPIPQNENLLCENELYCGLPILWTRQLNFGGFWIPGPAPTIRESADLKLLSHDTPSVNEHNLNFLLTGSHMISLFIRPKDAVTLKSWSLLPTIPEPTVFRNQKGYFITITHGLESEPLSISLTLKTVAKDIRRTLLDITVVTHHFEYQKEHTVVFAKLLSKIPSWAYAVPSVAYLKSWSF